MRTEKDNGPRKGATFKVTRKLTNSKHEWKNSSDMSNEEEANFVRKLKRGTCKYKGKAPLKCFKCGKIGNFGS